VLYDLEVPDFSKEPLSMSSIALTSAMQGLAPTARPQDPKTKDPRDPLAKLLPGPLTTYRDFVQADEIALFAEVYEAGGGPAHKVEISATMKAEGGQTVFETREERDSSELAGSSGGYGFSARIPLKTVPPGLHVIRVEAQSRVGDRPAVSREIMVNVVATPPTAASPTTTSSPAAPQAPPPPSTAQPRATPMSITTLNSDMMSGIDRAEQVVARTPAEWQGVWARHAPGRPAPTVDFSKNMVVAVFLGSRPSGGFQVQITGVRTDDKGLVVQWSERRPGRDQMAAQVMTSPSHIVTVPRHDGPVRFEKVEP
jgi:hypothetical protein